MGEQFTESVVEDAALAWIQAAGWVVAHGPHIAPDQTTAERLEFGEVVLAGRLRRALARLNPNLPQDGAFRKLTRPEGADLIQRNRATHQLLVKVVTVEYRTTDENATIWGAFHQLQTYESQIPSLFDANAVLLISDGVEAGVGTLSAGREWFKPWRTISGEVPADASIPELQVAVEGLLAPRRFLDLIRDFLVFDDDGGQLAKQMAGYHQYHAVQVLGDDNLRLIARELVETVRKNVTID